MRSMPVSHESALPRSRGAGRVFTEAHDGGRGSELMGVSVPGEATTAGQPAPPIRSGVDTVRSALAPVTGVLRPLQVGTRRFGTVAAVGPLWIGFNVLCRSAVR